MNRIISPARAAFAALGLTLLPGLIAPTIAHADPPRDHWDHHDKDRRAQDHDHSAWANAGRHDRDYRDNHDNRDNHWRSNDAHGNGNRDHGYNQDHGHDHDNDHHHDHH